jgi:hypothetical protein
MSELLKGKFIRDVPDRIWGLLPGYNALFTGIFLFVLTFSLSIMLGSLNSVTRSHTMAGHTLQLNLFVAGGIARSAPG